MPGAGSNKFSPRTLEMLQLKAYTIHKSNYFNKARRGGQEEEEACWYDDVPKSTSQKWLRTNIVGRRCNFLGRGGGIYLYSAARVCELRKEKHAATSAV